MFLERLTRPSAYLSYTALLWGLLSIGIGWCNIRLPVYILTSTLIGVAKRPNTPKSILFAQPDFSVQL